MNKALLSGVMLLLAAVQAGAQQYLITTAAGGGLPPTPAQAVNASFSNPYGLAVAFGNVYFTAGNCVFKVDAAGVLSRVAGSSSVPGYSGDGGPAIGALLNQPQALAVDAAGNLYIAEMSNHVVRRVTTDGLITTVAGNGSAGYSGDGGPAASASLYWPQGLAVDRAGNLYIADGGDNVIRKVAPSGIIVTFAGNGVAGYSGDGGPAAAAELRWPQGVAVDTTGNLYIADTMNNVVRKVSAGGIITTLAGNGTAAYSGDGGPATAASLNYPLALAVDAAGDVFISDRNNFAIRRIAGGAITTVAGNGKPGYSGDGGPATSATLYYASSIATDSAGNLFIADSANLRIRRVAPDGTITTVAGNGLSGRPGDGGPATNAVLGVPDGVAVDSAGNFYIAEEDHMRIRKVTPDGTIITVAGNGTVGYSGDGGPATQAQLGDPAAVAVDAAGNLYIADTDNSVIRKVTPGGTITTIAGRGGSGYSGDEGPATSALLNNPWGVAADPAGNLYIADTGNNRIRKVALDGTITTLAGNGWLGYSGDGGPAVNAAFHYPYGVAVDTAGNVYVADSGNSAIRKIAPSGIITTVAGTGAYGYSGDGGPASSARLAQPNGVAVDGAGNLYIADTGNAVIRKIAAADGTIATVAGTAVGQGYSGDGGPALSAGLSLPWGIAVDTAGNVYVADVGNNVIRLLVPQGTRALLKAVFALPGNFSPPQTGANYTVLVSNAAAGGPTSGAVTVTEIVPAGLTLVSMSGAGWNCSSNTCTRSDALNPGSSYPPIAITGNIAADPPSQLVNEVAVSGGGSVPSTASTTVNLLFPPEPPVLVAPPNGAAGFFSAPVLLWNASDGAVSYDVYFGPSPAPPLAGSTTSTSFVTGTLTPGATYYWQIVAWSAGGAAGSTTWLFTTASGPTSGLRFVPVNPCRVVDTRSGGGEFGAPSMTAGSTRSFEIPHSACNISLSAQAYSLNVTAVPEGPLSYLTLWPSGQARPLVSTLNSWEGTVVANAAIVPAGPFGAINVYVTDLTDLIVDINGYFESSPSLVAQAFYPVAPCRVADTRGPAGLFGAPSLLAGLSRDFPIPLSPCGIPASAGAYSLNFTAVPPGPLAYLTAWPSGQAQPLVSTLNSWNGRVVADAAIVPVGTNESISVFVPDPTDLALDVNGYFSRSGEPGGLSFYPVTPCRVADTRNPVGPFGGPRMEADATRSFLVPAGTCGVPSNAAAYSLNVTVVPDGPLSYLTLWPAGSPQPGVSTLNSFGGTVVANAAIVPAGSNEAISVFVTNSTQLILDIDGYFAP